MFDAMSYASGPSEIPLLGETIGRNLERTVARVPDREAMVDLVSGRRWTYRQFEDDVDTVARGLMARGIAKGDRVGIWSPNCPEWVLLQYATAKVGAILVNINPAYRTHELAFAVQQSGMRLLVAASAYKSSDYRRMAEEIRGDCPELEQVVYLDSADWDDLRRSASHTPREALAERMAQLSPDDPINIQYTSGTTGSPKGATLSHHNIVNNGYFVTELLGLTEEDRVCLPVPFYHCFGMVMGNLGVTTHGACIVIPAATFEPGKTLEAVQAEGCTVLYGVPTMFVAELEHPDFQSFDLTSLRTGIMAGSPCPVEVMKRCINEMHMIDISICYGMTETSPVSTQTRANDDLDRRVSTVGAVHPFLEVKVVDPSDGRTVPRGTSGELCTRGYSVMLGYWNDPEMTRLAIDESRWMHTGDLAVIRDDGYVNIVGRIKDMIIRGGENIYPREIEEFLYTHPDIADVQVFGVPDERYGEEVCAWVRMRPGAAPVTVETLREFSEGELARYKVPRYVHVVDEFPMTVTGKVRKVEMREQSTAMLNLGSPGSRSSSES